MNYGHGQLKTLIWNNVTIELAKFDICLCVNKENPHRYDYGIRLEDQIRIGNRWHKNSEVEL